MAGNEITEGQAADGGRAAGSRAPGRLETVRAFVNTLDIEAGTDELGTPQALASWLADHGLSPAGAAVTTAELGLAVRMREGLRAVLRSHAVGQPGSAGSSARLGEVAGALRARLCVDASGQVRAVPDGDGAPAGLAAILLIAAEATTARTWPRLKVCGADDCQWAFYDRSPARSGHWCSMAVCGSRAKSRAYRRRLRA